MQSASDDRQRKAAASKGFLRSFGRIRTLHSLRVRDFRLLWVTGWCNNSSLWVEGVVLGWLTYQVTQSALLTTLSVGMGALPSVVIGPLGGVYIDRWDRKALLRASIAAHIVLTAALTAIVFAEVVAAWHIFAYIFVNGAVRTVRMVIESSLIPNIVPSRLMTNAFSLFMLTGSFTRFIVPAVTGVAIGLVGSGPTMTVALVLYILALVVGLRIQLKGKASQKSVGGSPANDLVEGIRYLVQEKRVLAIYILPAMLMLFIAPVNMGLMPVYVDEVFGAGPDALGFIIGSLGAGMSLGTLILASLGDIRYKARAMTFACMGTIAGVLLFSQMTFLPAALAVVLTYSGLMMMVYVLASTAVQAIMPDRVRGRVTALLGATFGVFPVGTLIVGGVAQRFGAQEAVVATTVAFGVCLLVYTTAYRRIWTLE